MLSNRYPATGGGVVSLENIAISFLISCLASIAAYYVCKWLDGDK
ncbi:nitrate reductase [Blautia obeum]|uniref:Nitrate reductase n=1 Tax=Blautia obeum TaxID=40520 RepID=A0A414JB85_9FIRM|nr:nitrate reductase [Blautia obeum]RHE41762.1 nitrate reductase [Blautia obeum]